MKTEKKTCMIGFKTTQTMRLKLEEQAELEDRSISYIINRIIEDYFKAKAKGEK